MRKSDAAMILAGINPKERSQASSPTNLHVISGEVIGEKSEDGKVLISVEGMVFSADDEQAVEMDALGGLQEGDIATVLLTGESGHAMTPLALGGVGSVDRIVVRVDEIEADYVKASLLEAEVATFGYAHITEGVIDNATIDHADVNNLSANYAHISNGVIDNAEINGADIVDGTITGTQIASATITGSNMVNGTITATQIANSTITGSKIKNGTIEAADIKDGTITGTKIASSTITNSNIVNGTITGAKIQGSTLTDIPYAEIDQLKAANVTAQQISAATGYVGTLTSNSVTAANLVADHATVGAISTTYATIDNLTAATGRISDLEADHVTVQAFEAEQGYIDALQAATADIATIRANSAKVANLTASELEADHATIGSLDSNYAQINMANVNNAWIANGTVKDGAISNAMIGSLSASKLTAGTINGNTITVTNLNADNITAGTLNGQRIGNGSLSLSKLEDEVYTKTEVDSIASDLQDEIDGAIETWTGTAVPTLQNTPAVNWTTNSEKDKHVGDVYFVVNSQSQQNGYNYRFSKINNAYSWELIKDTDITNALQRLSTAEGQITTFDSDISTLKTDTGSLKTRATNLETRMTTAEGNINTKVSTQTFNELSSTVDANSATITTLSETTTQLRADLDGIDIGGRNLLLLTSSPVSGTVASGATDAYTPTYNQSAYLSSQTLIAAETVMCISFDWEFSGDSSDSAYFYPQFHGSAPSTAYIIATCSNSTNNPARYYPKGETSGHYWIVFKLSSGQATPTAANLTKNRARMFAAVGATLTVSHFKLEFGNKPTGWTPAPEDLEGTVTTISNTVNSVSQTATTNSSVISNLTTTLATNADGTTKAEDIVHRTSSLEQDLDGFKQTVSETYATQSTVGGIANRVSTAETTISQHTNAISLKANSSDVYTKTESNGLISTEVTNRNSAISAATDAINLSVSQTYSTKTEAKNLVQPNLTPFFATDLNDKYNATTNPGGFWQSTAAYDGGYITKLADGWVHAERDNSSGTSTTYITLYASSVWQQANAPIKPGSTYTILAEMRNIVSGSSSYLSLVSTSTDGAQGLFANAVGGSTNGKFSTITNGELRGTTTAHADFSSSTTLSRTIISIVAGERVSLDIRISIYEGNYVGPFKPYVDTALRSYANAQFKIQADAIESRVEKNGVISSINQSAEAITIDASRVNITGAAIFTSGRLSEDSLNAAYDANGAAADALTSAQSYADDAVADIDIGGRNLLKNSSALTDTWTKESATVSDGVATITKAASGNSRIYQMPANGYWGSWVVGDTYTVSVDAKGDSAGCVLRFSATNAGENGISSYKEFELNTEWTKYSYTFTVITASTGSMSLSAQGTTGDVIQLRYPKLEKGTKATDWTPAPEDVANDISTKANSSDVYTKTETSSAISTAKSEAISSANDATDTKLENYSTTMEMGTAISSAVDAIDIGGRNLLLETGDSITVPATGSKDVSLSAWAKTNILASDSLTISFDAVAESDCYMDCYWRDSSTSYSSSASFYPSFALTTSVQHFTVTQMSKYDLAQMLYLRFRTNATQHGGSSGGAEATITNLKLEKGTKATDWTPAPEDVAADISAAQSTADNAAPKSGAIARTQRIYYRATTSVDLTGPTTWLSTSGTGYGNWSLSVPPLTPTGSTTKYPYLYTATQTQTVAQQAAGSTCTCSTVLIDDTATVIDGGNIITGSVTANQLDAQSINAWGTLTVGALSSATQDDILNSNVEIGTRNLLAISGVSFPKSTKGITVEPVGDGWLQVSGTLTGTGNSGWAIFGVSGDAEWIAVNDTYTLIVENDGVLQANVIRAQFRYSHNGSLAAKYLDTSSSVTQEINGFISRVGLYLYGSATGTTIDGRIRMTLVKGNKAVDWMPAPEDVSADISEVSTVANNAAPKADAVKRTQRIYYRKNATGAPDTPSAWVTQTADVRNQWAAKVPKLTDANDATYPYLYTCEQREMVDGDLEYTAVLIDDSITVIDGGNIITGTVSANSIDANSGTFNTANIPNLNASKITAGTIDADRIASGSITSAKLDAASVKANIVQTTELDAAKITSGYINSARIQAGSLSTSVIDANSAVFNSALIPELTANHIKANVISAVNNGTGTINADKINVSSISIGSLSGADDYSTTQQMNTAIGTAVNAIDIGGRNLALGTAPLQSATKTSTSAKVIKRYDLSAFAATVLSTTSKQYVSFDIKVSSGTHRIHPYAGIIENDTAVTKSSVSGSHYATTEWTRISLPMTLTATPTWVQVTANSDDDSNGVTYEMRNLKFETGTKATDWTPAPEDEETARKATYGTCSTAAGTDAKVVVCDGFEPYTGARLTVNFSTANTTAAPTLTINDSNGNTILAAKAIWNNGVVVSSDNPLRWGADASISFVYDGTEWVLDEKPPTYTVYCETGASTRSKVFNLPGALIVNGTTLNVRFRYANTYTTNSVQFNLSSTGATNIRQNGATTSSTNTLLWDAGMLIVLTRQGSYWYLADNGTRTMAEEAAKTATTYLTHIDNDGLMVHDANAPTTGVKVTSSVDILRNGTSTANFGGGTNGDTARIGVESGNHISIDSDSVDILKGSLYVAGFEGSSIEEVGPIATEKTDTFKINVGTSGDIDISAKEYRLWENGEPEPESPKSKEASFWIQGDSDETSEDIPFDHSAGINLSVGQGYGVIQLYGEEIVMSDPYNMDPEVQLYLGKPNTTGRSAYATAQNVSVSNNTYVKVVQLTIPSTGMWLIITTGLFESNATGRRIVVSARSIASAAPGYDSQGSLVFAPANGTVSKFSAPCIAQFNKGEIYYVTVWQNSGSSLNVSAGLHAVRLI